MLAPSFLLKNDVLEIYPQYLTHRYRAEGYLNKLLSPDSSI